MEDILRRAKIKRAELMIVIGTLVEYYAERAKVYSKRASRLKYVAMSAAMLGIGMLVTFIVECDGSMKWIVFGMVSVAFTSVGAVVITFFEKRHDRANECMDRISELHEFTTCLREETLTPENAQARKQWYTSRIGILKCEYLDSKRVMGGGLEFEELAAPIDVRSGKLLDEIADLGTTLAVVDLSSDLADAVADGISDLISSLAV